MADDVNRLVGTYVFMEYACSSLLCGLEGLLHGLAATPPSTVASDSSTTVGLGSILTVRKSAC